jgi:hypothetical protein
VAESSERKLKLDIIRDMRLGLRTKAILHKHQLNLTDFERILKTLIKEGIFTKDEYRAWKSNRGPGTIGPSIPETRVKDIYPTKKGKVVETYVIEDPEKNHAWALQLFSTKKEAMKGANFKVILHGKKYSFTVEDMVYRGAVNMLEGYSKEQKSESKDRREEAMDFIAKHGWAAFLEAKAFEANFGEDEVEDTPQQARLVVLHCKHDTFLAALHTPSPAISFYVSSSLESVIERLSKSVDTSHLHIMNE